MWSNITLIYQVETLESSNLANHQCLPLPKQILLPCSIWTLGHWLPCFTFTHSVPLNVHGKCADLWLSFVLCLRTFHVTDSLGKNAILGQLTPTFLGHAHSHETHSKRSLTHLGVRDEFALHCRANLAYLDTNVPCPQHLSLQRKQSSLKRSLLSKPGNHRIMRAITEQSQSEEVSNRAGKFTTVCLKYSKTLCE